MELPVAVTEEVVELVEVDDEVAVALLLPVVEADGVAVVLVEEVTVGLMVAVALLVAVCVVVDVLLGVPVVELVALAV